MHDPLGWGGAAIFRPSPRQPRPGAPWHPPAEVGFASPATPGPGQVGMDFVYMDEIHTHLLESGPGLVGGDGGAGSLA